MKNDPTLRFSDRVENYRRYRPGYPAEVLDVLRQEIGLRPRHRVADIGAGTGISAELFLGNGNAVDAVEPNDAMRVAADELLGGHPGYRGVAGTAENTTLADASVDLVVAAQAFHWFDRERARAEFARILCDPRWVVLLWNDRQTDSTPFLRDYEALLQAFGTDYREVQHRNIDEEKLAAFFRDGRFALRSVPNHQDLDYEALEGRLLSSSYTPTADHPAYAPMLNELRRIFDLHQVADTVRIEYETQIVIGKV